VINARIEGVHERPLFRNLVTTHRCVIPLSGYYEWVSNADTLRILGHPSKKVPYYITSSSTESGSAITLSAAGLWRREGDMAFAVMLTTSAVQSIATVHDRMPVLLFEEQIDSWLSSSAAVDWEALARQEICDLVATRVGNSVNSTRNDSSDLLIPYRGDEQERLF
jgi:putative SOS response-associated peptidase YedK